MQKRTREILALVLLAVLVLVAAGAAGYYILVGHNWNVTASRIDDSIGHMDGYTVVLYPGTIPPYELEAMNNKDKSRSVSQDEEGEESSLVGYIEPSGRPNLLVGDVVKDYMEKEATVFKVNPSDLSEYREPFIVEKNGKRYGFMAVENSELRSQVRRDIAALKLLEPDAIVAVTNDPALAGLCEDGTIQGITIAVFDSNCEMMPDGRYFGGTYCSSTPAFGQVGAIVISPTGVCSTKTAVEL